MSAGALEAGLESVEGNSSVAENLLVKLFVLLLISLFVIQGSFLGNRLKRHRIKSSYLFIKLLYVSCFIHTKV